MEPPDRSPSRGELRARLGRGGQGCLQVGAARRTGSPDEKEVPLLAFVGRLAEQKGIDLIAGVLQDRLARDDAQWVILGHGRTELP